jgi:hypothetical protein
MHALNPCKFCRLATSLILAAATLTGPSARADSFTVTYLAPGIQTPSGITNYYETFNSTTLVNGALTTNFNGSNITGTYTGGFGIHAAGTYGGAGGTGSYLAQAQGQTTTLTLSQGVNYFGLWFSALDATNDLQFYSGSTLLYSFTAASFISGVGACPSSTGYCGNPNSGYTNSAQQYAYINFYDTTGTFNIIKFSEGNTGNFESDNNAVAEISTQNTQGTILSGSPVTPEPASVFLLGTGLASLLLFIRHRQRMGTPAPSELRA